MLTDRALYHRNLIDLMAANGLTDAERARLDAFAARADAEDAPISPCDLVAAVLGAPRYHALVPADWPAV